MFCVMEGRCSGGFDWRKVAVVEEFWVELLELGSVGGRKR